MKKLLQILILTALLATTLTPAVASGGDPWPDVPTCTGCK